MGWIIRRVGASEAELILPLLQQVQSLHAAALPETFKADATPEDLLGLLREMLGRDEMVGLAAVAPDGSALGYALVEAQAVEASAVNHARRRGVLHHVCVDATWRGRGLGSALVEEAKAWLRAQGVARLGASYWTFNEASAALMRRAGLRPALIWAEGAA